MARARCPRSSVEAGQKYWKIKHENKATFFSPSENRYLPASTLKPEEREFVVDFGASMHMISEKDLNSAEMDTLTKSYSPTIVITANGEVQTHEVAIVYVKELDKFLTMTVLENTPAEVSLGKLCEENGYSYEWINGQKPHLIHRPHLPLVIKKKVAIVYVKEWDIFLTMKVLEDTPAVLSLGKHCDEHGYSYEWINGQKPHLIKHGIPIQ